MPDLDVRGLPPPEPFLSIMQSLHALPEGDTLSVLIHREPFPLYDVLRDEGYLCETSALPDGNFALLIRHAA